MRLIKQGELWALDRRAGLDAQVALAVSRFRTKHGKEPAGMCWNPGQFSDARAKIDLPVDKTIPPGHLWLELGKEG